MNNKALLMFFLISNLYSLKAEIEPNNNCAAANLIQLDLLTNGYFQTVSDQDYFKIEIPIEGTYSFDLYCKDTSFPISFRILNENCDKISYLNRPQGLEKINCNLIFCNPGIYYFFVSNTFNTIIQEPYYFNLAKNFNDIHECNNSISDAFTINLDQRVDVLIDGLIVNDNFYNYDQEENFKLSIPSKGILLTNIFDLKGDEDLNVIIYDSNENFVNCICCIPIGSDSSILESLICEPGNYYIKIRTCNTSRIKTHTSCSFTTIFIEDTTECNNTLDEATLIENGQTVAGYFGAIDSLNLDIDYYKFKPSKIGLFNFDFIDFENYVEVKLYDANYNLIQNYWKSKIESTNSGNYYMLCDDQYYFFSLKYANNLNNCDPANNLVKYSFKLNLLSSDPYECNNKFEDAHELQPNQILYPFMDSKSDDDYFSFRLHGASSIAEISISDIVDPTVVTASIYDEKFRLRKRILTNPGSSSLLSQQALADIKLFYLKLQYNLFNNYSPIKLIFRELIIDVNTENPLEANFNLHTQIDKGLLEIDSEIDLMNFKISIVNSSGTGVERVDLIGNKSTIDLTNFVKGIYFINFNGDKTNVTKKFIVF